jgi:glucosyl-dolichyl phosphate glucuronosyltransferase
MPKISVIVSTYNRCESLKDTLDSLLAQEEGEGLDYEVLMVDNNSQDKTREVIESYIPKFKGRLRYLFEPRQGVSFARNRALQEAKGEIVAFTDDDCIVSKNWLREINSAFKEYGCAGIAGKILPKWECELPRWFTAEKNFKTDCPLTLFDYGDNVKKYDGKALLPTGSSSAFKKELFEKYGFLRTDLGRAGRNLIGSEDADFCRRLLGDNLELLYIPGLVVFHKFAEDRLNKKYFKKWFFYSGRTTVRRTGLSPIKGPSCLGIPRWLYREIAENFMKLVYSYIFKRSAYFYQELKMLRSLGQMHEYLLIAREKR